MKFVKRIIVGKPMGEKYYNEYKEVFKVDYDNERIFIDEPMFKERKEVI